MSPMGQEAKRPSDRRPDAQAPTRRNVTNPFARRDAPHLKGDQSTLQDPARGLEATDTEVDRPETHTGAQDPELDFSP